MAQQHERNVDMSQDNILKLAIEGYSYELKELIRLYQSDTGAEIISFFSNFDSFISDKRTDVFGKNILQTLTTDNFIDAADLSDLGSKLFAFANLAASCGIFGGWIIPLNTVDINKSDEFLKMAISGAIKTQPNLGQNMADRLNNGDTIRIVQILKLLGLLEIKPEHYQLSTGCSVGGRDRMATHTTPQISINHFIQNPPVKLSVQQSPVHDIVLIDNDVNLKPVYDELNANNVNIYAFNQDFYIGLDQVAESIASNKLKPRTLITAYRLEPRAYTDVSRYLSSIGRVIDSQADFLTTIGSGDTDEEFRDRKQVMEDIFNDLLDRGMKPVRIKMYTGDSVLQQRSNPLFGLNQYASYEIIYCKLKKELF